MLTDRRLALFITLALYARAQAILFPVNGPTINYFDTLDITYSTPWQNVKVSTSCYVSMSSTTLYGFWVGGYPFTGDGTVDVCKVGDLLSETVVQYPVPCFVGVTNYDNISDSFYGGNFTMASTAEGTPTTWALPVPTSNAAISSAATATSSPNDPSTSTQATAISSESNGPTNAPQISSSPSQTSAPSLSTGAKVGIAFGAIVTTAIIVSFIYFLRLHRRLKTRITTPSAWQNDQQRESASLMTLGTVELPNNQPPGCQPEAGGMHQSKSCDLKGQVSESMDEPIRYELGQH